MNYIRLLVACVMLYSGQVLTTTGAFTAKVLESWEAVALSIWDGNNLDISKDGKIYRVILSTVMAPQRGQPYSKESRMALKNLVYGQKVQINVIRYDRYGRLIAEVKVSDKSINTEMVKLGMVWVYKRFNDDESLIALEEIARKEKTGLWRDDKPVEPWDYRKNRRQVNQQQNMNPDVAFSSHEKSIVDTSTPSLQHSESHAKW